MDKLASRRQKFLDAPYDVYAGIDRILVVSHCPDDDYRFDFIFDGISWKLAQYFSDFYPISISQKLKNIDFG